MTEAQTFEELRQAIAADDRDAFTWHWDWGQLDAQSDKGCLLEWAGRHGRAWVLQKFIEEGEFDKQDRERQSRALAEAAECGHTDFIKAWLDHPDPNLTPNETRIGRALDCAVELNYAHAIEILWPMGAGATWGSSALYAASKNNNLPSLNLLIPLVNPWEDGGSALNIAAKSGHTDVLTALIPVVDQNLIKAAVPFAASGHLSTLDLLLNACANYPTMPMEKILATALTSAAREGALDCFIRLETLTNSRVKNEAIFRTALFENRENIVRHLLPNTDLQKVKETLMSNPSGPSWKLINRLAFWVPDDVAQKWISENPEPLQEAQARIRHRKAQAAPLADEVLPPARARARP